LKINDSVVYSLGMELARPSQPLNQHAQECAESMSNLLAPLNLSLVGRAIGMLHDLGKKSGAFQKYISSVDENDSASRKPSNIDHSTAGAQFIWKHFGEDWGDDRELMVRFRQLMALCIVSHHNSSLIDCWRGNLKGSDVFQQRINKDYKYSNFDEIETEFSEDERAIYSDVCNSIPLKKECQIFDASIRTHFVPSERKYHFLYGLLARHCMSCLVEADYTSASGGGVVRQPSLPEWDRMLEELDMYISRFPKGGINDFRSEISHECYERASGRMGKWSLTLPTGAGKTLASLRFALKHALEHKLSHVFYVIPYTSIIDQTAQVISDALGKYGKDDGSYLLKHHSNIVQEEMNGQGKVKPWSPERMDWYMEACQRWHPPIILTTAVQYLDALYANGKQFIRRMHSLANSVVIFDEVQAIPTTSTHLFDYSLDFLTNILHSTTVCSTATLPNPDLVELEGELPIVENARSYFQLFSKFRNLEVKKPEYMRFCTIDSMVELAYDYATKDGSVLLIVNTKHMASRLTRKLIDKYNNVDIVHLSTNMCPAHRKIVLEKIGKYSFYRTREKIRPIICVSTSLIEAGVDVDFAVVIRSTIGLASCVQSAGRCNREGKRAKGTLIICKLEGDDVDFMTELKIGQSIVERQFSRGDRVDLFDPSSVTEYYSKLYKILEDRYPNYLDYCIELSGIHTSLVNALSENQDFISDNERKKFSNHYAFYQAFETANKKYHVIEDNMIEVIMKYHEGADIIDNISRVCLLDKKGLESLKDLLSSAMSYVVHIRKHELDKYLQSKKIKPIRDDIDVYALADSRYYDEVLGFDPKE
jgi:CRISPR-associated endonuclease/helicase Cas3